MESLRIAWRNLWRNTRRSLITMAAVGVGTAVLVLIDGLMRGMVGSTIRNATNLSLGEVQVHAPEYLVNQSMYRVVESPEPIVAWAREAGVASATRSYGYGLLAQGKKSAGARFWGVDPAAERAGFDLAQHVTEGSFLGAQPGQKVVLGRKLARKLGARIGDELVVVVQAADGSMGNELFTVGGVLATAGDEIDRGAAIIHREDFEMLFVSDGRIHEVALNSRGRLEPAVLAAQVEPLAAGAEVRTWQQLLPMIAEMMKMMDSSLLIFGSIFFLAAGLGVLNTMLMATYDRIREFGLAKALGASPGRILGALCLESALLAAISSALGAALGIAVSYYFSIHGLDTTAWAGTTTMGGIAFDPVWRTELRADSVYLSVSLMTITCLAAGLYPAILSARLEPVAALNHT